MLSFFRNNKGSVTVFVTLLLIPSILVTGTAVDLSRIHTARSIVQDANQLAANSVLTQYQALVKDIYGLYGVMEDDPILGDMLNEYINISIFGDENKQTGMGTFQLFSGTGNFVSVEGIEGRNLSNADVLRRQIEEYAKFRAPVIIIDEILETLDSFKKIKEDSEVIKRKVDIDKGIGDLDEIYSELYVLINEINTYEEIESQSFDNINKYLDEINRELKNLEKTREDWGRVSSDDFFEREKRNDLETKFNDIAKNIKSLVSGGELKRNWEDGYEAPFGYWNKGHWRNQERSEGLNKTISASKESLDTFINKLDKLNEKAKEADAKKEELRKKLDQLKIELDSGKCSKELVDGMKNQKNPSNKSVIEEYEILLGYDVTSMALDFSDENKKHIQEAIEIIDNVAYGSVRNNTINIERSLSRNENLVKINTVYFIDRNESGQKSLRNMASLTDYKYAKLNKFKKFQDIPNSKNKDFYVLLKELNSGEGSSNKKKLEKGATNLLNESKDLMKTLTLTPDGAKYYKASSSNENTEATFFNDDKWNEKGSALDNISNELDHNIISKIGDLSNDISNKALLLTYCSEMFSNFTTEPETLTMSGVPMSTDINYFFQSELEYLFNGNSNSARTNISAVVGMLFLVRFVFNYTSTFFISEVNNEITKLSASAGTAAFIVREVLRLAYATAESAIDVKHLLSRPSEPVSLIKNGTSWSFSLSSVLSSSVEVGINELSGVRLEKKVPEKPVSLEKIRDEKNENENERSIPVDLQLDYKDYLRIFLIFKSSDDLGNRTADLISWNITNKKNNIKSNEGKMSTVERFDMSKALTDFQITTSVDMNMLFLSMPFAQRGIDRVVPPKSLPIIVTDYRGY